MEFIAILANTARSQAYLQTLLKENLKPTEVFILDDNNEKYLGKISNNIEILKDNKQSYAFKFSVMNPEEDLITTLSKTDIPYTNPTVPIPYVLGALFIMVVLGTLIGLIPAQRAVSIKPIDALREE